MTIKLLSKLSAYVLGIKEPKLFSKYKDNKWNNFFSIFFFSSARSLGDNEVGRLVVTIIEGAYLHPSDPHGMRYIRQ